MAGPYVTARDIYGGDGGKFAGSARIKSMVDAVVMASPPTLTAQAADPSGLTRISPAVLPARIGGAGQWIDLGFAGAYYPKGARKTNDVASAWGGAQRIEFDLYGSKFSFKTQFPAAGKFKIWVNEQPHALAMQLYSTVSGANLTGSQHVIVDFGTAAFRRIQLEMTATAALPANFQGIWINTATDLISLPSIYSPKVAFIHDSYGFGVGPTDVADAPPIICARALGFSHLINNTCVPSTGIIKTDAGNNYGNYASRLAADLYPAAPDLIVYSGTVNDGPSVGAGTIGPQMLADLAAIRANLPNAILVTTGPMYVGSPSAAQLSVRDEVGAAAASFGVPFVDMFDGRFTDANQSVFGVNVGGFHPTTVGAKGLGLQMAAGIAPYIGQAL